ncbi:MAG: PIN domain-containing protein [Nitrospirae bacterium]|nr:PIN domain-containing protein [Nitrospirota bacterium]
MTVFFDTSVLVAALVKPHPMHSQAINWLKRAKSHNLDMIISSHTLAELYAVLTTLPVSPKITPEMAWRLISENIEGIATIISLSSLEYIATIKHLRNLGLSGGIIYDALAFKASIKSNADKLVTFNVSDFKRLLTDEKIQILSP